MSDEKIVNLVSRRKPPSLPGCGSQMATVTDMLRSLLKTMESEGKSSLVGCVDGWDISIQKTAHETGDAP